MRRLISCLCATFLLVLAAPLSVSAQVGQRNNDALLQLLLQQRARQQAPPAYITANPYIGQSMNRYDSRVNPYSAIGSQNPYTISGGQVYGQDGQYLGRLNANRHDPESVSNPYGRYGSPYSPTSINNPYGRYGSPYSPYSATNRYTTTPPVAVYPVVPQP